MKYIIALGRVFITLMPRGIHSYRSPSGEIDARDIWKGRLFIYRTTLRVRVIDKVYRKGNDRLRISIDALPRGGGIIPPEPMD